MPVRLGKAQRTTGVRPPAQVERRAPITRLRVHRLGDRLAQVRTTAASGDDTRPLGVAAFVEHLDRWCWTGYPVALTPWQAREVLRLFDGDPRSSFIVEVPAQPVRQGEGS